MKSLNAFGIIAGVTLLGELLHNLIPLPLPAAIYGIILLFIALCLNLIKVEQVKPASDYLLAIMAFLFVPPVVSLTDSWHLLSGKLFQTLLIIVASTVVVFAVSGLVTDFFIKKEEKKDE